MNAVGNGVRPLDAEVGRDRPDQARLARLAEEQAALRRVATLVARATPPEEVFAAVVEEARRLFLVDVANLCRYDPDGMSTVVASVGERFAVGTRVKRDWPRSRSWWRRRSRTRRAGRNWPHRAGGSSPHRTRRAAGSSVTCTTAPNSGRSC